MPPSAAKCVPKLKLPWWRFILYIHSPTTYNKDKYRKLFSLEQLISIFGLLFIDSDKISANRENWHNPEVVILTASKPEQFHSLQHIYEIYMSADWKLPYFVKLIFFLLPH